MDDHEVGSSQNLTRYRPDIEGLRAVAVVPVIFYHFGLGFPGGFVGVDIFFVISGFLITSLILKDMEAGAFSIRGFWERRVRRIYPPLIFMLILTTSAAFVLLLPDDLREFGRSLMAQMAFGSNIFFWKTITYFDSAAELKPLLHTWSLAVEEQFYLFFPLLLFGLRGSKRMGRIVVGTIAIVSLVLSAYGVRNSPSATFYLLPTRSWELALGSLLAMFPEVRLGSSKYGHELGAGAGAIAIVASLYFYSTGTPFPGLAALPPCLGAGLIILANRKAPTAVGRVLSMRGFTLVGAMSYSLYLWHWPILAFTRYWKLEAFSLREQIILLALMVTLSAVSWIFVETPFRKRKYLPERQRLFSFAALASGCLVAGGFSMVIFHGFAQRLPADAVKYALAGRLTTNQWFEASTEGIKQGAVRKIGLDRTGAGPRFVVWGDSHAMSIFPVLEALANEFGTGGVAITHSATPPVLDLYCKLDFSLREDSIPFNRAAFESIKAGGIRNVLLIANWRNYLPLNFSSETPGGRRDASARAAFERNLANTFGALQEIGCVVWIMEEVPDLHVNVPRALARASLFRADVHTVGIRSEQFYAEASESRAIIDGVAKMGAHVLDPGPFLTEAGFCFAERHGNAVYRDAHHLTPFGSMLLKPMFEPLFRRAAQ